MQPVLSAWTLLLLLLLIADILALAGPVTEELHLHVHACAYACRLAGKVDLGLQNEGEADVSIHLGHDYDGYLDYAGRGVLSEPVSAHASTNPRAQTRMIT